MQKIENSSRRPIFDAANQDKSAVIIRGVTVLFIVLGSGAFFLWGPDVKFSALFSSHPGWVVLGGLLFLALFPLVTYVGMLSIAFGGFGFFGGLLGAFLMLVVFFARAFAYGFVVGYFKYGRHGRIERWKKGDGGADPFYRGLLGGSADRATGIWSLPIKVGVSGSGGSGSSGGGGKFGGGGAHGKY